MAASRPWSVWKGGGAELRGEGRKGVEGETEGMRQTKRTEKPDKLIDKNETNRKKREQIGIYKNERQEGQRMQINRWTRMRQTGKTERRGKYRQE